MVKPNKGNFSLAKKIKFRKKSQMGADSPGPIYLQVAKPSATKRSISIPRERRPDLSAPRKINLGPGQYELSSIFEKGKRQKGMKFSTDH